MTRVAALQPDQCLRDQQVLARMARGELGAVGELYDCYGRLVFALMAGTNVAVIAGGGSAGDHLECQTWNSVARP